MDRRQKKTRDAIFSAFMQLLSKKSYNKMTVQDIIDTANVGRTTFYAHFPTKDDVLIEMCTDLFDHVFEDDLSPEGTHDFSFIEQTPEAILTHILYHLRDSERNIAVMLSSESGELFVNFFKRYLDKLVSTYIVGHNPSCIHIPTKLLISHISAAFVNLVQWWIKDSPESTPEELANYFSMLINPIIYTDCKDHV